MMSKKSTLLDLELEILKKRNSDKTLEEDNHPVTISTNQKIFDSAHASTSHSSPSQAIDSIRQISIDSFLTNHPREENDSFIPAEEISKNVFEDEKFPSSKIFELEWQCFHNELEYEMLNSALMDDDHEQERERHKNLKGKKTPILICDLDIQCRDAITIILDRAELNDTGSSKFRCLYRGTDVRASTHLHGVLRYFNALAKSLIGIHTICAIRLSEEVGSKPEIEDTPSYEADSSYADTVEISTANFIEEDSIDISLVILPFFRRFFGTTLPPVKDLADLLHEALVYVLRAAKTAFDVMILTPPNEDQAKLSLDSDSSFRAIFSKESGDLLDAYMNGSFHEYDDIVHSSDSSPRKIATRNLSLTDSPPNSQPMDTQPNGKPRKSSKSGRIATTDDGMEVDEFKSISKRDEHHDEDESLEARGTSRPKRTKRRNSLLSSTYDMVTNSSKSESVRNGSSKGEGSSGNSNVNNHGNHGNHQQRPQSQSAIGSFATSSVNPLFAKLEGLALPTPVSDSVYAESSLTAKPKRGLLTRRKRLKIMHHPNVKELVFEPKGLYETPHGYRVQLNLPGSSHKFSRNVKTFVDAVWLYEIAILISDCPTELSALLESGNFNAIVPLKIVGSAEEYYNALGRYIQKFSMDGKVKPNEFEAAVEIFDNLKPLLGLSFAEQGKTCVKDIRMDATNDDIIASTIVPPPLHRRAGKPKGPGVALSYSKRSIQTATGKIRHVEIPIQNSDTSPDNASDDSDRSATNEYSAFLSSGDPNTVLKKLEQDSPFANNTNGSSTTPQQPNEEQP